MIYLNSGTPGSGKSLNVARDIMFKLRRGHNVISNFPINLEIVKFKPIKNIILKIARLFKKEEKVKEKLQGKLEYKIGKFLYIDNSKLNPTLLVCFAKHNHKKGREGQTLLIIDECPVIFNPREYSRKDRPNWIKFFQLHRHLGYNVILIAQNDRLIDRQIRAFIEYNCKHRKINNFGTVGMIISLLQLKAFVVVTYWYGVNEKCGIQFFTFKKMYSNLYDSYSAFDRSLDFSL
ncbi:zonular occludens toxin domain-containing protein [Pseudobacteroides cellulosolvens]|uniref:Zonular occludens toxin n=1 Tax=Pseudobacteroides cellulosolvens ATCC 35603 = DSM 2933 TaxID=398512 RepID=A0A0L6JIX2_9FIRM|nr:zonular occludens toxin domain-containing protein [Pseudobacteroides cellulosolvens]KNY25685.1 Zonular occludens toxin [Pseudobacteroides cellulosolvens ATCC 35603 = DSM 2933]